MTVSETGLQHRPAMYWFDLRQQFGVPGVLLAALGFCYVLWRWPRRGASAPAALRGQHGVRVDLQRRRRLYLLSAVALRRRAVRGRRNCGSGGTMHRACRIARSPLPRRRLLLLYPAWRGYDTFPAVDRSWDRRAEQLLDAVHVASGTESCSFGRPGRRRCIWRRHELAGAECIRVLHARAQAGDSVVHDRGARVAGAWKRSRERFQKLCRRQRGDRPRT